jgi:SWI/SNF-related matrix-associated actin-dependent regulator 1 of chromatin subfamily A
MLKTNVKLFPYQEGGVRFLEERNGCGGVFDSMGLGKTLQAIAFTTKHNLKTLIICPAYLKYNWADEIDKFTDNTVGMLTKSHIPNTDYIIVNYEMLHTLGETIRKIPFDCAVLDESQYVMNIKSKRTIATYPIIRDIPRRILLSGTPIKNRVAELFTQLDIIRPGFCDKKSYYEGYVGKKVNLKNHEIDPIKLRELNMLLKNFCIRRQKRDVLKDLPEKSFTTVGLNINPAILQPLRGLSGLEYVNRARTLLSRAKIKECVKMVQDHVEQDSKVLVYSQHVDHIMEIFREFKDNAVLHYGGISPLERNNNVKRFQEDPNIKVLVGNTDTAVGYTATAADTVIFLDLPWSPSDLKQAEDRAHRIGQKNAVTVKYLIALGTLEEQILRLLQTKEKLLHGSLDGSTEDKELDIRDELLESLRAA